MIIILSPAKSMDFKDAGNSSLFSVPEFGKEASILADRLRSLSAKELGDLSRTIISENFRGVIFKTYVLNEFNLDATVNQISQSDDPEINSRVESKLNTYLKNLEKDLIKAGPQKDFDSVKIQFSSKYRNLPQKYHK